MMITLSVTLFTYRTTVTQMILSLSLSSLSSSSSSIPTKDEIERLKIMITKLENEIAELKAKKDSNNHDNSNNNNNNNNQTPIINATNDGITMTKKEQRLQKEANILGLEASILDFGQKKKSKSSSSNNKNNNNNNNNNNSSNNSANIVTKTTSNNNNNININNTITNNNNNNNSSSLIPIVQNINTNSIPTPAPKMNLASLDAIKAATDATSEASKTIANSRISNDKTNLNQLKLPSIKKADSISKPGITIDNNIQKKISTDFKIISEDTSQSLFYMYDLEEEFWWRWPEPGTDCSGNGYVGHEHAVLSGLGTPISPDDGLFLTWHFSLFSSLHNRFKRSSRRTRDPSKASLFIIPYDLGLDGYLNAKTCQNSRSCTSGMVQKLHDKVLKNNVWFDRYGGADHAVLWSLGQYHPWPRNGCDVFMKDYCAKCTFTCYWMDSTKKESKFISVPFPSGYHWWDGIKNLPWESTLERNMTAVYLGSTQTLNPAHTKIRRAMTSQCNASVACHWLQISHNSKDASIADYLSVYKKSIFCLCPPGDDPARKAVFDAILSGCIPVIFEKATLYNQYPWHIGEEMALDISVSIPGGLVRSGKLDFMKVLLSIPEDVIRKKQKMLAKVAPRVQYAIPPIEYLKNRSDETTWDPPFLDGAEITLNGMFDRVYKVLNNISTNIPNEKFISKTYGQEYEVVIIKVPDDENRHFNDETTVNRINTNLPHHHNWRRNNHAKRGKKGLAYGK